MFKFVKDARRRAVEATLATVGKSERTVDENLENNLALFHKTAEELNKSGSALNSSLIAQKASLGENAELASLLYRMWAKQSDVPDNIKVIAQQFHEAWAVINEVYRSAAEVECLEKALKPVSNHVTVVVPEMDEASKKRAETVVDYDSYRRRLKTKEAERDTAEAERANLEAQGKPSKSTDGVKAEVTKYEAKVANAESALADQTSQMRVRLREADAVSKDLLYQLLITSLVVQEELFMRSAAQLRGILDRLPPEHRQSADSIRADVSLSPPFLAPLPRG